MKNHAKQNSTTRFRFNLKNISVFWRTFLMLILMTLFFVVGMLAITYIHEDRLKEGYLQQAQSHLDLNFSNMATALYNTYAIPTAIESSSYFNYVRSENDGVLPDKYISVLPPLRRVLTNQLYLQGNNEECILYFSGCNSIVTRGKVFQYAEDCFDTYIGFSETENAAIMDMFHHSKETVRFIPAQRITIGSRETQCIGLLIHPSNTSVKILSLFSAESILDDIGFDRFPSETNITIKDKNGTSILSYPEDPAENHNAEYYTLSTSSPQLPCTVSVHVPDSYFEAQLQNIRQLSWFLIAAFFILGLAFCLLLSYSSSKPIQRLVDTHRGTDTVSTEKNEILALEKILGKQLEQRRILQDLLLSNLLARAYNGMILNEKELALLEKDLPMLVWPCRLAILYIGEHVDQTGITNRLDEELCSEYVCQIIGLNQVGILFSDSAERMEYFKTKVQELIDQLFDRGFELNCGISGAVESFDYLHSAVRQARSIIPQHAGITVYGGSVTEERSLSWLQHERLYQSIINSDEDGALQIFEMILQSSNTENVARRSFYNVLFVLRSACEELSVYLPEIASTEYDNSLLPRQNLQRLNSLIQMLFARSQKKNDLRQINDEYDVVLFIEKNYADSNLCAAMVAEALGLSEKKVYAIVRKVVDQSFNEYLMSIRMKQAGQQLCATDDSTNKIALRCGYQAESTFYRVFKKYYGMTPQQYRQKGGDIG